MALREFGARETENVISGGAFMPATASSLQGRR